MEALDILNSLNLNKPLTLSPAIMWSVFMFVFIVFVVFSTILFYHWAKYDWDNKNVRRASAVYLSVSALIFIAQIIVITMLSA